MKQLSLALSAALGLSVTALGGAPAGAQVYQMGIAPNGLATVQRIDVFRDGQWVPQREITRIVSRSDPASSLTLHVSRIVRLDDPARPVMEEQYWGRYTLLERYVGAYGSWTCTSSVAPEQMRVLRVGAVVSYTTTCTNGAQSETQSWTRRVLRAENIRAAGRYFPAVVYDEELTAADGMRTQMRRWFVLALGIRVRSEWTVTAGANVTRYREELVSANR